MIELSEIDMKHKIHILSCIFISVSLNEYF